MTAEAAGSQQPALGFDRARRVADAVMYEGYALYPYRASAPKNRLRWQFGAVFPRSYEVEPDQQCWQCVIEAGPDATLHVLVRFLQLERRSTGHDEAPWDEGVAHEVPVRMAVGALSEAGMVVRFGRPGQDDHGGQTRRCPVQGQLRVRTEPVDGRPEARCLTAVVENVSAADLAGADRSEALCWSMVGTHTMMNLEGGRFVSAIDPPDWAREVVEACHHEGVFPVLVGPEGDASTVLAAPVVLYDHPDIAPESPGDFHDSTEIDELLTLRTMTLTDAEKEEARRTDPRTRAILERVEQMSQATMSGLHGTFRRVRPDGELAPRDPD